MMNKKGIFQMIKDRRVSFKAGLLVILLYLTFAFLVF